jgi:AcrR family transcriptional regulator
MSPEAKAASDDAAGGVRERILDAAMTALREAGIQGLSQVQVARRAKVRQSHLTYYFPRRHDLIEAVAQRFIDGLDRHIVAMAAGTAPGDLGALLQRLAAAIADHGHMRMFTGVIVEADGDPELRASLVRVTRRLQAALAERLGGEDAMERAGLLLASLWGLGLYDFVIRPERRSASMASLLARAVEGGSDGA